MSLTASRPPRVSPWFTRPLCVALALLGGLIGAVPVSAAASPPIGYACKFPEAGPAVVNVEFEPDTPATWPLGERTAAFPIRVKASGPASALAQGDAASIEGWVKVDFALRHHDGTSETRSTNFKLDRWTREAGAAEPVVLSGTGTLGTVVQDEATEIVAGKAVFNLRAKTANGNPIPLPPLTTDLDGQDVRDQDSNPATWDVHCRPLASASATVATISGSEPCWESEQGCESPQLPTGVRASTAGATGGIVVWDRWNDPSVRAYALELEGMPEQLTTNDSLRFYDLTPGTAYHGTIRAVSKDPAAPRSEPAEFSFTTPAAGLPSSPGPLRVVTQTTTSITLAWNAATSPSPLGPYWVDNIIYAGTWAGESWSRTTTSTTLEWTGLQPGTKYLFRVRARNAALGESSSQQLYATTATTDTPIAAVFTGEGSVGIGNLTSSVTALGGARLALVRTGPSVSGGLSVPATTARLRSLGTVPVSGKISFSWAGVASGELRNGALKLGLRARIKLSDVRIYGSIPIGPDGYSCLTRSLVNVDLASNGEFSWLSGGKLEGQFAMPDLNRCAALNGLVSPATAGADNRFTLDVARS